MRNPGVGMVRMRFKIPARGLLGYRSEFLTDTRGTGIMHHRFFDYGPWAGPLQGRTAGSWWRTGRGCGRVRALQPAGARDDARQPGDPVYEGMVVGRTAGGRHGRQPVQGKEAHEHADDASDEMIILEPRGR